MNPRTSSDAYALGAAGFEDMVTIRDFMRDKVRPILRRVSDAHDEGDATVYASFLRANAWLGTLAELKEPQHFQAALAGTRALFEICVDLALLHHDPGNHDPSKVAAWERSAKLKAAERLQRCFEGRTVPEEHQPRIDFITREGATIRIERAQNWGGHHPDRWTRRSLENDAEAADALGGYGFREYYDVRFAELCWGTHGSGLAGVRFIPEDLFPALIATAFDDAARWAVLVSELSLRYFDKLDIILEARFRELEQERKKWRRLGFAKAKGYVE